MADQLNMGGLSLGPDGQPQQGARSYIPPHMRNRGPPPPGPPGPGPVPNGAAHGPGPIPGPGGVGPAAGGPLPGAQPQPPVNGLGNSNWAK